ncbi:MAG: glutamyl-tRNA reductase [Firmicutes bacterium]|nr:glutamyl-tRNA reductase [Bacillota bacterium]
MQIFMAGIDHSTASVVVRERFSFTTTERNALMGEMSAHPGFEGCVLLSTCNRTELWISSRENASWDPVEILCRFKGLDADTYRPFFCVREGEDAISYLFEVSSGLKSRIIGEDQILAQVKKALNDAREAGCCGSVLDVLFRSAVTGAKKVKTELSLSTANASAVECAIDYLKEKGMVFAGKKCLVIGNGEMGKRTASALLSLGAQVTVTIRQYRSGIVEVVPGCKRIDYSQRYSLIPQCDMVVSATSSPNTTITYGNLTECGDCRGKIFIDLAVPRDIDPEIGSLEGVELLNIDSFSVPRTEELLKQLAQAEMLLAEQKKKFLNWFECRDMLPEVEQAGDRFAEEVLFRMGGTLKSLKLPPEESERLRQAVRDAARKELKKTVFTLRDEAGIDVFRRCLAAVAGGKEHG